MTDNGAHGTTQLREGAAQVSSTAKEQAAGLAATAAEGAKNVAAEASTQARAVAQQAREIVLIGNSFHAIAQRMAVIRPSLNCY